MRHDSLHYVVDFNSRLQSQLLRKKTKDRVAVAGRRFECQEL
jgi:hypothetical protein